jgi:hydrogenase nickel incorporation protein HypB
MCSTCGCGEGETRITTLAVSALGERRTVERAGDHAHSPAGVDEHDHTEDRGHRHPHASGHDHPPAATQTVLLEQNIMAKNDLAAAHNRGWFNGREIVAINLMSSPGSGKTTLLARTIADLAHRSGTRPISVVEGDQETLLDAERIRATGVPVVQINTGAGCHLDAEMLQRGLASLAPTPSSLVFIENVGNLVCPALFDLGEAARVVVISVTEGEDKPRKYPHMFEAADLVVINKSDLLPYVDFDVEKCLSFAQQLKPSLQAITLSATTGEGVETWYDWLTSLYSAAH